MPVLDPFGSHPYVVPGLQGHCDHNFTFQGLVFWYGGQLPGSSARARFYADRFYCSRCLRTEDRNQREMGNSYEAPLAGAMPR